MARVAGHLGVPPKDLRIPVMADDFCLSHSVYAARNMTFASWMDGRNSQGVHQSRPLQF